METLEVTLSISLAMLLYTAFQLHPNAADAWNWHWGHRTLAISDFPQVFLTGKKEVGEDERLK